MVSPLSCGIIGLSEHFGVLRPGNHNNGSFWILGNRPKNIPRGVQRVSKQRAVRIVGVCFGSIANHFHCLCRRSYFIVN